MKLLNTRSCFFQESDLRLDASFHLSDGPLTKLILKKSPFEISTLGKETKNIFKGNIFKRVYVSTATHGFPFMTASDMMKTDMNSGKFVSKKYTKISNLLFEKGWTLVSRSGTLGNTAYTSEDYDEVVGTDDLIRVVPDEDKQVRGGYLYAYLSSKYGYGLLTQSSYGGVVKHIEPHHIENLPIPMLPDTKQQQIHNLIEDASSLRVESNAMLKEAIDFFDKKYCVNGLVKVFKKNIKNCNFSLAAYNNNLECDTVESLLLNDYMTISDIAKNCFAPPLFKHIYLKKNNGHPFLTGAELTKFHKKYYRWLSPRGVKNIQNYKISKGTLLFYKSGTTDGGILGNVFIADDILDGACLSDHVIRVSIEDLAMAYWAFAFFKSSAGIRLLLKLATGSVIPFITPERLKGVKLPKPDENFKWVVQKIESYIANSVESQMKEQQAISLVEKEIESWQKS